MTNRIQVDSSNLSGAVGRLLDVWRARADYLEQLAGYNDDVSAQINKTQARVLRGCIGELDMANDLAIETQQNNSSGLAGLAVFDGLEMTDLRCPRCNGDAIYKDFIAGKHYQCDECCYCFDQIHQPPCPSPTK